MTPFERFLSSLRKTVMELRCEDAVKTMHTGLATLIDVREQNEWQQGHIPGAIHLPRSMIEIQIGVLIPNLETPIILYCSGGVRSLLAAENLQRIGYTNVKSLAGGSKTWCNAGLPFTFSHNNP
jgi:rhodanese-related sulfurtransferase